MRILLGLTEVSGHYGSLKQGFCELGLDATFWNLTGHPFAYGNEDNPFLVRWIRLVALRQKRSRHPAKLFWALLQTVLRCFLFVWAIFRFDVFVFGFNTSFLRYYDLPVLKLLGKKIVYQFHGSDSRPPYLDGSLFPERTAFSVETCIEQIQAKKRTLQTIGRYADVLIDNPTGAHFHERPVVIWLYVGLTSPAAKAAPAVAAQSCASGPVRILHCPSNPAAKGTALIERAIERIQARGHLVEFVKITGRPNSEILRELQECDFVVDQAYSDYAMPGFATEAAWFGKPVVIGGYASELWRGLMPGDRLPPTIFCSPERMEAEIERLVVDHRHRQEVGRQMRQFVETHWQPREVAQRYLELIGGRVPAPWWFDSRQTGYVHGCCAPDSWISELIHRVVQKGGAGALMVGDKPQLERDLIGFSKEAGRQREKAAA
ncbi:MAG: glycosyltransferase [Gemmataceae bacterium]